MSFKRAVRKGQHIRIPLLCDPDYRAARLDRDPDEARAEEARFAVSLDPADLLTPCAGVTHAVIRGLSGSEFAESDDAAMLSTRTFVGARADALIARGLVKLIGAGELDALAPKDGIYPVEQLADYLGPAWSELRVELHARIVTASNLGESSASPCAPSSGEAT